jgi:hypothetical protein
MTQHQVRVFDENKLYGQPAFTAAGLGGKTKFWEYVKAKRFRVVRMGRLTKVAGSELNAFIASLTK